MTSQLERLSRTIDRQDFDNHERQSLHEQVQSVRHALAGRWTG